LISIRQSIDENERFTQSFQALVNVFQGLANALPKAALPASPELSEQCRDELRRAAARLKESPSRRDIDEAGAATLSQLDDICKSNQKALEERDAALKDVVGAVAGAVSGFKGDGARHETSLSKLADGFDALSRISDVGELRRRLRENVAELRQSVEEMRRQSDASVRQLETQVRTFEQRLEAARKGAAKDRLTDLGSRREAERRMQQIPSVKGPVCLLLFDIEGFTEINNRYGTTFGDKLLQALAHTLKARFPDEGVFRWGADEFLVVGEGPLVQRVEQCRGVCAAFAGNRYATFEAGAKRSVSALLLAGAAQYTAGESMEELYRRARASLEHSRSSLLR
jgi:diguanylate cyclase (GGDEF)-like protein